MGKEGEVMAFPAITPNNLENFIAALEKFRQRKGEVAHDHWLNKMNPEFQRHVDLEMTSCGDGYTPRMAKEVVRLEFQNQPYPMLCPECGEGVAWYRATAGVMKCNHCEATITELDWR